MKTSSLFPLDSASGYKNCQSHFMRCHSINHSRKRPKATFFSLFLKDTKDLKTEKKNIDLFESMLLLNPYVALTIHFLF